MGRALPFLSPADGIILMLALPGAAWLCFGPLCMAVNRWPLATTLRACLAAMWPGSLLLAAASLGFARGGGIGWAIGSVLAAHFVMMAAFIRAGRRHGRSTRRLGLLWFLGLDGIATLLAGGVQWL